MQSVFQSSDFTCGSACVLAILGIRSRSLEFDYWARSNCVFMGKSHPGCGPYGLAHLLQAKGRSVTVLSDEHPANIAQYAAPEHRSVVADRELFLMDRYAGKISNSLPVDRLRSATVNHHVMLLVAKSGSDPHWVVACEAVGSSINVFDPWPGGHCKNHDSSGYALYSTEELSSVYTGVAILVSK